MREIRTERASYGTLVPLTDGSVTLILWPPNNAEPYLMHQPSGSNIERGTT